MIIDKGNLKYPVGIQSFSEIREGNYVYVDKTPFVHKLIQQGKYYFLSRPRRFGKSLLLSTIEAYFKGRRDLFKGLAIDSLTEVWDEYPILHLDLNNREYSEYESLIKELSYNLEQWEALYGIPDNNRDVEERFANVIKKAFEKTGKKVVILVDEYDKPMLNAIDNEPLANRFRETLKAFYSNLKTMDPYIKIAVLTGVSRFTKVSIFSDLNNLRDISFEPRFAAICGITDEEIDIYFKQGIENLSASNGKTYHDVRGELKKLYDGYHFSENLIDVYNPFSLVNVFASQRYSNYWIASGTPTYVARLMKKYNKPLKNIERYKIMAAKLATEGILSKELIPTLYQSGYLTIKDYDERFKQYTLGYPNEEVEEGFIYFLLPLYLGSSAEDSEFNVSEFVEDVQNGKPQEFMRRIGSMLRGIPHLGKEDPHEHTFQNAIYLIFKMVGFFTAVEDHTSDGRIDLVLTTSNYVYVFEFKVDKTAELALQQIHEKEYWKKYEASGKQIFLIGANFNTAKKALDDFIIELVN